MTASTHDEKRVTLINVFTVEPGNQQRLVDLLGEATERSVRHAAGFIAARLQRSLDGTKVTMVSEWRSAADYEAMRADPAPCRTCSKRWRSRNSSRRCMRSCGPSLLRLQIR